MRPYPSSKFLTGPISGTDFQSVLPGFAQRTVCAPGGSASITVTVRGDKKEEANETFAVNLTGATDGTISDSQGIGTIVNDDGGAGNGHGHGNSASSIAALLADDPVSKARKRK